MQIQPIDVSNIIIAAIAAIATFGSGIVNYIAARERKLMMTKFKEVIASSQANGLKLKCVINALSELNGETKIGEKFRDKYRWHYSQEDAKIKEFEKQSASLEMDL